MRSWYLFLVVLVYSPGTSAAPDSAFRLGAILPLTGDSNIVGESIRNGMMLALEELPPAEHRNFSVSFEDDANVPRNTVNAFKKLSAQGVNLVVAVAAQPSMAVAPLAEAARIPLIVSAIPKEIVKGRRFVFLYYATVESLARTLIEESVRRKYRTVARISAIHDGRAAMKRELDQTNGSRLDFLFDEEFPIDARDFRAYITKLKHDGRVDAIFVNLYLGQIGLFARQAKELDYRIPLFGTEFFRNPDELRISQGALRGHWGVELADPHDSFRRKYQARFPNASLTFATTGYDLVRLAAEAMRRGVHEPEAVVNFLRTTNNFESALGTVSVMEDNRFDLPVVAKVVE